MIELTDGSSLLLIDPVLSSDGSGRMIETGTCVVVFVPLGAGVERREYSGTTDEVLQSALDSGWKLGTPRPLEATARDAQRKRDAVYVPLPPPQSTKETLGKRAPKRDAFTMDTLPEAKR